MDSKNLMNELPQMVMANAMMIGCDADQRVIFLNGEIDEGSAYRFTVAFKLLDRTPGPIHVILNSVGGSIWDGLAIYDCIRCAQNPVAVEGIGVIASAAVPVLLAGAVRFLNPSAKVMIHNGSWGGEHMTTPVFLSMAREMEAMNKRYVEIIAQRTGMSVKDVEAACAAETWYEANEAMARGFADRVLVPRTQPRNFDAGMEELREAARAAGFKIPKVANKKGKKVPQKNGKKKV